MLPWWECLVRLLGAMILGAVLGLEREASGKPAGFRTHILVCLGATLYVVVAQRAAFLAGEEVDAVRAMTGVAQGVGFLGAGLILQTKGEVRWLTTATSLWVVAALGLALGLGAYWLAIAGCLLAYVTLHWLDRVESALVRRLNARKRKGTKNQKSA